MLKKTCIIVLILFLTVPSMLWAEKTEKLVISISDFQVNSDIPAHKYIGKGLSLLIATELRKSKDIVLLEREQLNKILDEQSLSLSDLMDATKQVQIGKLLSAQKLIMGEIVDMGATLLISLRMVDVENGAIGWQESLNSKLETYDYISAYFANSILKSLQAQVRESTLAKIEKKEVKKAEAVVKISEAVDALDKGKIEQAKADFKHVQQLDPGNEAASYYLAKLVSAVPKFRVETEYYAATYNPAYLGLLDKDTIYMWLSSEMISPYSNVDEYSGQHIGDYTFKEYPGTARLGYAFPLNNSFSLGVECVSQNYDRMISAPSNFDVNGSTTNEAHPYYNDLGGSLSLGFKPLDNFSLGLNGYLTYTSPGPAQNNPTKQELSSGLDGGFLVLLLDKHLIIDMHAAYSWAKDWYLNEDQAKFIAGSLPLILESSVSWVVIDKTLSLALKNIDDIYLDERGGHALRLIPIVEYTPFDFLSLRAGYEFAYLLQNEKFMTGHGLLAGLSLRFWDFELNGNFTVRKRPAHILPGYMLDSFRFLIGLSYTPGFLKR